MANAAKNSFLPDYAVHPGEILQEELEVAGMQQAELADRLGVARKTVNEIIKGKAPITADMALKLERVFHLPAHVWSNLQRNYEDHRARLDEEKHLQNHLDWLRKVPVTAMVKKGWIRKFKSKTEQLAEVLSFFAIAAPEQWQPVWKNHQVAYRRALRPGVCEIALSAWLRKGEIEAQRVICEPFDKAKFQTVLQEIRGLTREEDPANFIPRLQERCATAGVAVVFVPELPKTRVCGATRWMSGKAVIQLSMRYGSNDQLWFTFFHEAGHIIKHGRKEVFVDEKIQNGVDDEREQEANTFAANQLISAVEFRHFSNEWDGRSLAPIEQFADRIGIAPGIVVGRLQFEKKLQNSHGNKLKVFYRWEKAA